MGLGRKFLWKRPRGIWKGLRWSRFWSVGFRHQLLLPHGVFSKALYQGHRLLERRETRPVEQQVRAETAKLRVCRIRTSQIPDRSLTVLPKLPKTIKILNLLGNPVDMKEVLGAGGCNVPNLTSLIFGRAKDKTIDDLIESVINLPIEVLRLPSLTLNDPGVRLLSESLSCWSIRELDLSYNNMGRSGIVTLCKNLCGVRSG